MFLPEPCSKVWRKLRKFGRRNLKVLTQLITGHAVLRYHLNNMNIEPEATCEHCLEGDETVEHFVCDCEAYAWARQRIFGTPFLSSEELKNLEYDVLLQYVRTTGRL